MKILFLNYEYPPLGGGAGVATEGLMKVWAQASDTEVHLVTSAVGSEFEHIHVGGRTYVHRLPIGKNPEKIHSQSLRDIFVYTWKSILFLRNFLREEQKKQKFDVTLAFFTLPSGFVGYLLKVFYNIPYVVSLRGADVPGFSEKYDTFYLFFRPLTRFLWREAAAVVTNSVGLRDMALATRPEQKISIIENGVDTETFKPDEKKGSNPIVFLSVSRLTTRKGVDNLIRAFAIAVKKTKIPIRLDIVGSGEQKESLGDLVQALGVAHEIRFIGAVDRSSIPAYYQEANVFIMASKNEGMSNAALEALASGLPLVVSNTGGMTELVANNENGLFIDPEKGESFAAVLVHLAEDSELRTRLGTGSRMRAEKRSWKVVAHSFHETLDGIH